MSETKTRVLVVDDSIDDREWLVSLLREARVADEISQADSLASAAEALGAGQFQLLITDHSMPDGNGVELASDPRVLANHTPVIVITGNEQPNQGFAVLGRGATDFLPKDDLTARALARACSHAIARRRLEAEVDSSRRAERDARVASELALSETEIALARVRRLQTLTAALSAATTSDDVISAAMRDSAVFERAFAGALYVLNGPVLELRASFGYEDDELERWRTLPLSVRTPLSDALSLGQRVALANNRELEKTYGVLPVLDGSLMALPLAREQRHFGVMGLRFAADGLPDGAWLEYLDLVAGCLSDALIRARWYEDAQAAAQQEERLLAIVGHDLRTPLSAINFGVSMIRGELPEHPVLARIERSATSMSNLIRDILSRAELRRGRVGEGPPPLADCETVLREQVEELRAAFPRARLVLTIDAPEPELCDAVRMSQLVTNLVRNALQHGDASAPVTVGYTAHEDSASLSVHNQGAPIPPEQIPALFNPFARGARSRGTGLGLFIVHETVASLGGAISVSSEPDGTTFRLDLPRGCWSQRMTNVPSAPPGAER